MRSSGDFIADTYALGTGPWTMEPVTRGALGQIWKLAGGGTSWAVKELLFGCDEAQVERESALRDAAGELGISAPRLMATGDGTHVVRLPTALGGSYVKLYDWIDGTPADASDPSTLSWCGRALAILHRAGQRTDETPNAWYERCPSETDWAELPRRVREAGVPWADALDRFVATSAMELASHVTPSAPGDVVTSHLDMRPQNVLVGQAGPVLLDWDNAGPISAERELARAVYVWSGGNDFDAEAARRLVRAYRDADGPGVVKGLDAFSMLFATDLNYVHLQAECAIDPAVTDTQRRFASEQVADTLRSQPEPEAVSRLVEALEGEW